MDSQDRDESKIRSRQESLARRLTEALDKKGSPGAAECPDSEIIAAYLEQALQPDESAQWEDHFAGCARCRNVLRVLAASADTPLAEKEVARLGELVSAARTSAEVTKASGQRTRPKLSDWRLRWLAPALGLAAVLAVVIAMRAPWRTVDRGATGTLVAQGPRQEVPASPLPEALDRLSKVAPQQELKAPAVSSGDRSSANGAPSNFSSVRPSAKDRAEASAALDKISPSANTATNSLQAEKKSTTPLNGPENQTLATAPSPPPKPGAQDEVLAPAAPLPQAKAAPEMAVQGGAQPAAGANSVVDAPSKAKQAVTAQAEAGATTGSAQASQETSEELRSRARKELAFSAVPAPERTTLKAAAGSALWRAGKRGTIERSTDAGKSWIAQVSPVQEDWLAGAAVSDSVCWLAGRGGAIARTVDGDRWELVSPPLQAAGRNAAVPDWTGISASDAQAASITASDGRKFNTMDGGKTWQQQ